MHVDALLKVLPPFERKRDVIVFGSQTLKDIIKEVLNAHERYSEHYDTITGFFNGYAPKKLFEFCQNYLPYKEEPGIDQTTKSPAAILSSGNPDDSSVFTGNDCKHYAGFVAGVLDAINRTGKNYYDWYYRFAEYEGDNQSSKHVFVVVDNDLWIDPTPIKNDLTGGYVQRRFNDRMTIPVKYKDAKPTEMLSTLSGVHYLVNNDSNNGGCGYNGMRMGDTIDTTSMDTSTTYTDIFNTTPTDSTTPTDTTSASTTSTDTTQVSSDIAAAASGDSDIQQIVQMSQQLAGVLPDGSLRDWVNNYLSDPVGALKGIIFGKMYNTGNYKLGEVFMRNILGMKEVQRVSQVTDKYVPMSWAFFTAALGIPIGSIDHLDQLVINADAYKSWANGTFSWVPIDQVIRANKIMNQYIGWTPTYYPRDIAWQLSKFASLPYIYPIWAVWDGNTQPKKYTGKSPITGQQITDGFPLGVSSGTTQINATIPYGTYISMVGNNGLFVSSENGQQPMNCNRTSSHGWEGFYVANAGNGKVALQYTNLFVSSENGTKPMNCNRTSIGPTEIFDWIFNNDGTVSLRNNGMYVSSNNGQSPMTCDKKNISTWEKFRVQTFMDGQAAPMTILSSTPATTTTTTTPGTPGTPTVKKAGFAAWQYLVFAGLAGGVIYMANKRK